MRGRRRLCRAPAIAHLACGMRVRSEPARGSSRAGCGSADERMLLSREGSREESGPPSDPLCGLERGSDCVRVAAMAVRKSIEESLVVDGPRADWLQKFRTALQTQGFTSVETNSQIFGRALPYR